MPLPLSSFMRYIDQYVHVTGKFHGVLLGHITMDEEKYACLNYDYVIQVLLTIYSPVSTPIN